MTRTHRTLLVIVGGIAALALFGALLLPRLLDGERYRRLLEQRVSSAIGREVRLGDVRLSLLSGIALRVDRLEVAGVPEEGGEDLLVADGLRVGVRLRPLLRGRLEVASAVVERPRLRLVRDAAGAWNVARLLAERDGAGEGDSAAREGEADAAPRQAGRLTIERIDFRDARVAIEDHTVEPPLGLVLTDLDLDLDDLASGGSFDLALDTRFEDAPEARLRWSGTAGPLGAAGRPLALRGEGDLEALDASLLAGLAHLAGLDLSSVTHRLDAVSGSLEVDAALPERAALRGDLDLGRVEVALPGADAPRMVAIDVGTRFDLTTESGAGVLRVESLAVDVDDTTLVLEGTIERAGAPAELDARRVDLSLRPVRLPADRLAAFLAMALPDLPFSFSSPQPIEAEARIHGVARAGERPEIDGRLSVDDLRFAHEAMALPIEHLSADVAFAGERVAANGVEAKIGESDLRGEIRLEGFSLPRVRFDLASRHADLDQLFGALESDEQTTTGAGARGDLLDRVEGGGRIRVEQVSWGDLEGSDLDATVHLEDGTVTLDPLSAELYAGRFVGRVDTWPGRSPLPFRLEGKAADVRVDRFLAGALGLEDRLAGRFSGTLEASGRAGEWAQLVRSLEGQGEMRIEEGEVASFPLLRTVAQISGVFGEESLAEVANRLAESATRFSVMRGAFRLAGGAMTFEEIVLESADYTLRGAGAVDLVSTALQGDAAMIFSTELSELMRAEESRAGELFWSEPGRVRLPLALRGALSDPAAIVDWQGAVQSYAERRVGKEVQRQVGKLLDRLLKREPTPTPVP